MIALIASYKSAHRSVVSYDLHREAQLVCEASTHKASDVVKQITVQFASYVTSACTADNSSEVVGYVCARIPACYASETSDLELDWL
jgi:hypothetical protein